MQLITQSLLNEVMNVTTFQVQQRKRRCDVTYIISAVGLGLASQEVDVLAKSTNENS